MSILRNIRTDDGRRYYLCDDTAKNDDRTVEDRFDTVHMRIDANLVVRYPDGAAIANIRRDGLSYTMQFAGEKHNLGPVNGYHWEALMSAEVEAAKIIIPTLD